MGTAATPSRDNTSLYSLIKDNYHVESLTSFSKRETWRGFFCLSSLAAVWYESLLRGRQLDTRNLMLCPPFHPFFLLLLYPVAMGRMRMKLCEFGIWLSKFYIREEMEIVISYQVYLHVINLNNLWDTNDMLYWTRLTQNRLNIFLVLILKTSNLFWGF